MKVLIVENDLILANVWSRRFGKDHDVEVAKNLAEAMELLQKAYVPEIVLLDLRLNGPNSSGLKIYEMVRSLGSDEIPVLIITGLEDTVPLYQEAYKISLSDPFVKLFAKPINIDVLKKFIK